MVLSYKSEVSDWDDNMGPKIIFINLLKVKDDVYTPYDIFWEYEI